MMIAYAALSCAGFTSVSSAEERGLTLKMHITQFNSFGFGYFPAWSTSFSWPGLSRKVLLIITNVFYYIYYFFPQKGGGEGGSPCAVPDMTGSQSFVAGSDVQITRQHGQVHHNYNNQLVALQHFCTASDVNNTCTLDVEMYSILEQS